MCVLSKNIWINPYQKPIVIDYEDLTIQTIFMLLSFDAISVRNFNVERE